MSGKREPTDTAKRCYEILRQVPLGRVTTYGLLAKALGCKSPRAVGQMLNRNPYAPIVPCHRVVMSNGSIGGFALGVNKKVRLLRSEGIEIRADRVQRLEKFLFRFSAD